ncbi:hypothetical protein CF326_g9320, partial [Tilletia indica]
MRTVHTAELVSICAVVWTIAIVLVLVLVAAASFLLSLVAELTNSALRSFTPNAFQRSSNLFYLAQDCANLGTMSVVKEQSCQLAAVNSAVQLPTVRVGVALLEGVGLSMQLVERLLEPHVLISGSRQPAFSALQLLLDDREPEPGELLPVLKDQQDRPATRERIAMRVKFACPVQDCGQRCRYVKDLARHLNSAHQPPRLSEVALRISSIGTAYEALS